VPPFVSVPLRNVTLLSGKRLNLTCSAGGDPFPRTYWTKDGESHIPRAQFTQYNVTLLIASVQISDEGLYECTVESRAGSHSSSAFVVVNGKGCICLCTNYAIWLQLKAFENLYINSTMTSRDNFFGMVHNKMMTDSYKY